MLRFFYRKLNLVLIVFLLLKGKVLNSQYNWNKKPIKYGQFLYSSKSFLKAKRYYSLINFYPNLAVSKIETEFYNVSSSLRLNDPGSEKMLEDFNNDYPTNFLAQTTYHDLAEYYFYRGKYSYALKWYKKIKANDVDFYRRNEYFFNKGYTLFATKQYKSSKQFFEKVNNLPDYEYDANYYLGYISYYLDDYDSAVESFNRLNNSNNTDQVGYFQAQMNFKLGRFKEAIRIGNKFLKNLSGKEYSEMSKIIGESHFNLKEYDSALPFLVSYKGKKGKWDNTDFYQLGYTYFKLKRFEKAISQFNKIIIADNAMAQNAYYHLAECYLQLGSKYSALNAFKKAFNLSYDLIIKEDAFLNYAKLSYEIGNPYENPTEVLSLFIKKYPKNELINEIKTLLVESYVTKKNYYEALKILEKESGSKISELIIKVSYMKAMNLFKYGLYEESIDYFNKVIKLSKSSIINSNSLYWKAQAFYELNDYNSALKTFDEFIKDSYSRKTNNYNMANYHVGYSYFKINDYKSAVRSFNLFLDQKKVKSDYQIDARLRLADSYFALKEYWPSMDNYKKIIDAKNKNAAYALYQMSISYGFVDRPEQKIKTLNKIINDFQSSNLLDDALFELALTYTQSKNNSKAIEVYDRIIRFYDSSPYRSKSLLNKALILYNDELLIEAYDILKRLVEGYPNESIINQAILTAKEISIDLGKVDDFVKWLSLANVSYLSENQIQNAAFRSAEKLYLSDKKKSARKALENYINKYPNGSNLLKINFYLAEIFFDLKKWDQSLEYYYKIVSFPINEFSEIALVNSAQILTILKRENESISILENLEENAQFSRNRHFAQLNLMKIFFKNRNYNKSIEYAKKNLKIDPSEEKVKWDSRYILAKSFEYLKDNDNAKKAFVELENAPQDSIAIEALFYKANHLNFIQKFKDSNIVIEKIANDYVGYPRWSAKSLILMSNNFYELSDPFQATFILESIIKNFSDYKVIVKEAKKKLESIKANESLNNSSINVNKNYEGL